MEEVECDPSLEDPVTGDPDARHHHHHQKQKKENGRIASTSTFVPSDAVSLQLMAYMQMLPQILTNSHLLRK